MCKVNLEVELYSKENRFTKNKGGGDGSGPSGRVLDTAGTAGSRNQKIQLTGRASDHEDNLVGHGVLAKRKKTSPYVKDVKGKLNIPKET